VYDGAAGPVAVRNRQAAVRPRRTAPARPLLRV